MTQIQEITDLKDNIIEEDDTFFSALQKIEACFHKILLIVKKDKLIGLISNGDLRRGLLEEGALDKGIKNIINYKFDFLSKDFTNEQVNKLFKKNLNPYIPVLDKNNQIVSLLYVPYEINKELNNSVLLMAGGKGTRLGKITENIPKPLVEVGGITLLEYQLKKLTDFGFKKIYISLHHMANQIVDKISELKLDDAEIEFLIEKEPLGTAGSLCFLKEEESPVLTLNCDVVTETNFREMITTLEKKQTDILVGVRPYNTFIPYGVIKVNKQRVTGYKEKPIYQDWVSAGINLVDPKIIKRINEEYLDMNELISKSIENYAVFPYYITERWIDVGSQEELSKLNIL